MSGKCRQILRRNNKSEAIRIWTLDSLLWKQDWRAAPVSFELVLAHLLKCVSFLSKTIVSCPKARLVGANIAIKLVFRLAVTLSGRYYFSKKYLELLAKPLF